MGELQLWCRHRRCKLVPTTLLVTACNRVFSVRRSTTIISQIPTDGLFCYRSLKSEIILDVGYWSPFAGHSSGQQSRPMETPLQPRYSYLVAVKNRALNGTEGETTHRRVRCLDCLRLSLSVHCTTALGRPQKFFQERQKHILTQ